MHELGLSRSIAAIVTENSRGRQVRRVSVSVGPLACVEKRALAFCWDIVTEGGPLAGSLLEFVDAEGDVFLVKEFEFEEAA